MAKDSVYPSVRGRVITGYVALIMRSAVRILPPEQSLQALTPHVAS